MRGLEERGALRGLVGSGAVRGVGGSEWLEDSGVQGACPFSHHRIYAHMYKGAPGGSGAVGPQSPAKRARQQLGASAAAALKTPYGAARGPLSLLPFDPSPFVYVKAAGVVSILTEVNSGKVTSL
jgi:hypothetical protein